jgi:hypothetical protein
MYEYALVGKKTQWFPGKKGAISFPLAKKWSIFKIPCHPLVRKFSRKTTHKFLQRNPSLT